MTFKPLKPSKPSSEPRTVSMILSTDCADLSLACVVLRLVAPQLAESIDLDTIDLTDRHSPISQIDGQRTYFLGNAWILDHEGPARWSLRSRKRYPPSYRRQAASGLNDVALVEKAL